MYLADVSACSAAVEALHVDPWTGMELREGARHPDYGTQENNLAATRRMTVCMRAHHYTVLQLTDDEAKSFSQQASLEARASWIQQFASQDLSSRLAAARVSAVPPLPAASNEPFVVGAARIRPQDLTVVPGTIGPNGDVLVGRIGYRRTARLAAPFRDTWGGFTVPAGTVFHQVLAPIRWNDTFSPEQTAWCAEMKPGGISLRRRGDNLYCYRTGEGGYEMPHRWGPPWLVLSVGVNILYTSFVTEPIQLAEEPMEESDALGLRLIFRGMSARGVILSARASKGGKEVTFWSGDIPFGADGRAVLPFWTHQVVLTRAGSDSVAATFGANGDGRGWLDIP